MTTTITDLIAIWATWTPENSLQLARRTQPDELLIFSLPVYQKMGAAHTTHTLITLVQKIEEFHERHDLLACCTLVGSRGVPFSGLNLRGFNARNNMQLEMEKERTAF